MNPLIKRTTERVLGHEMRQEDMSTAVIIGNAIFTAVDAVLSNPDFNLKGGNDIDKNTIGNFDMPIANEFNQIKTQINLHGKK